MTDIVDASASSAGEAASLIYQTDPGVWDYLFEGDRPAYDAFAGGLWVLSGNSFSHSESVVVRDGAGGLAGLEMGYRGALEPTLRHAMRDAVVELLPQHQLEALLLQAEDIDYLSPFIPPDAYYLHFLSVQPERRGQGLGGRLLENALARGRQLGCSSIHLDVFADNPAVGLYRAFGFREVVQTGFPRKSGLPAHLRMVRTL